MNATPHPSLGLLELGLGNFAAAAAASQPRSADTRTRASSAAGVRPCALDLVEALVRSGKEAEARVVLDAFDRDARRIDRPLALAFARRGRGLLARPTNRSKRSSRRRFASTTRSRPVRTRTHAALLGRAPRRARRRADAGCSCMPRAMPLQTQARASGCARARAGARGDGERVRERRAGSGELTPQERRVAVLVSEGLTNREVAARSSSALTPSRRILRHLFQKLGVRSRTSSQDGSRISVTQRSLSPPRVSAVNRKRKEQPWNDSLCCRLSRSVRAPRPRCWQPLPRRRRRAAGLSTKLTVFGGRISRPAATLRLGLARRSRGTFSDQLIWFSRRAPDQLARTYACAGGGSLTARAALHLAVVDASGTQAVTGGCGSSRRTACARARGQRFDRRREHGCARSGHLRGVRRRDGNRLGERPLAAGGAPGRAAARRRSS